MVDPCAFVFAAIASFSFTKVIKQNPLDLFRFWSFTIRQFPISPNLPNTSRMSSSVVFKFKLKMAKTFDVSGSWKMVQIVLEKVWEQKKIHRGNICSNFPTQQNSLIDTICDFCKIFEKKSTKNTGNSPWLIRFLFLNRSYQLGIISCVFLRFFLGKFDKNLKMYHLLWKFTKNFENVSKSWKIKIWKRRKFHKK